MDLSFREEINPNSTLNDRLYRNVTGGVSWRLGGGWRSEDGQGREGNMPVLVDSLKRLVLTVVLWGFLFVGDGGDFFFFFWSMGSGFWDDK